MLREVLVLHIIHILFLCGKPLIHYPCYLLENDDGHTWENSQMSEQISRSQTPFYFKGLFIFIVDIWTSCLHVCMLIASVPGAFVGLKRELELELQMICSHVCSGNTTQVLQKAAHAHNCRAISPAPGTLL